MGPPCKQRSQTVENWNSGGGSGSEGWPVERLQQTEEDETEVDYREEDGNNNMLQASTVSNRWDPVLWYSRHGYNVSEMIKAPANLTSRGLVRTSGTLVRAEELGIVLVVLSLWAAAIALFINRWGKIRLMEPYHPYIETAEATPTAAVPPSMPNTAPRASLISNVGRNSLLLPGVSRDARRPSLLCVLEQHARRQSTLSLLSADYGLGNPSRRLSASSKALLLQAPTLLSSSANTSPYILHTSGPRGQHSINSSTHTSRRHSQSTTGSSKPPPPPTFLVTNHIQNRNRIHRNSLGIVVGSTSPQSNHRSRSFDGRELSGAPTFFENDESRRHSVSSCTRISGATNWRKSPEVPTISQKRSSLDVNVTRHQRQIIIPDIRTEQVCRIGEMAEAPKLFLSSPSPEREAVLPQSDDTESAKSRPKTWRSQTAFELSSSMSCESEASFIINEFLQKTVSNNESVSASDPKLESYV